MTSQESALVVNVKTEIKLQHALTGEELDQWVKYEDVSNALEIDARDRVVYDNWIGTVEEVSSIPRAVYTCACADSLIGL